MLLHLHVRGLALLDDLALDLAPGMNVLTGETGAGKSIIIDALTLLRGARGRVDLVRHGESAAAVSGEFQLASGLANRLDAQLDEHGLPPSEGSAVLLQRTLPRSGRGRSLVQGAPTTQAVLASVGEQLVDICSQHEHHSLTQVGQHLTLLDGHARLDDAVAAYGDRYAELRAVEDELERLRRQSADALQRADYLRFQLDELDRVRPEAGEDERLEQRLGFLRDAQRWAAFADEAQDVLYEAGDAVVTRLGALRMQAERGSDATPVLAGIADQLTTAIAACEEAHHLAGRLRGDIDLEPGELEAAEERLDDLNGLKRKHGCDLAELAKRREEMAADLANLDGAGERLDELEAQRSTLTRECTALALDLRERRRAAATSLARALEDELKALHIPRARLEARLVPMAPEELGPRGMDRCEFLFSANPGEALAPLNKVASGGELSRVLLALKGVLATGDPVVTYVFDEVDAGVGGAVAESIGQRLARAASATQVLCITHLPQIAAFADRHFHVEKVVEGERTVTRVTALNDEARVEELARMLGGARITDSARQHARQLIDEARASRAAGKSTASSKRKAAATGKLRPRGGRSGPAHRKR